MFVKKLDKIRKWLMPKLTGSIGKNHFPKKITGTKPSDIKKILVCRPNQRLGNILLITPLIQELERVFPDGKIDVIVKGTVADTVLKKYKSINRIIVLPRKPFKAPIHYLKVFFSVKLKKYDLVINGDKDSSSGRILAYLANSTYKLFGFAEEELKGEYDDYEHMAKNTIYNLRHYLDNAGLYRRTDPSIMPSLDLKLTQKELANGKAVLNSLVADEKKETMLIFTHATGAKCYSKLWWSRCYSELNSRFGHNYNIIEILPYENISRIDFKTISFYSTDIREIASLMANAEMFIGADSGIMHLASASGTTTIGLFSVTDENKYRPYSNRSISFNTEEQTINDLMETVESILD